MANLIQQGSGEKEEKAIKVELPDGTSGEIPIKDASLRTSVYDANNIPAYLPDYKEGGKVKKYNKGEKVRKGWVKDYEDSFKTKEELEAEELKKAQKRDREKREKAPMRKTAQGVKRARKKLKRKGSLGQTTVGKTKK